MRNNLTIVVAVLSVALVFSLLQTDHYRRDALAKQSTLSAVQAELDALHDASVAQDSLVAYFAEIMPAIHVLRVEATPEQAELIVVALAGPEVLRIQVEVSDDGTKHNLDDVLRNKIGSLLFPVAALADAPGGQGVITVNAPAGMRIEFLDVVDRWAKVSMLGLEGYLPLWIVSLNSPSFYMHPIAQRGHNPLDRAGHYPTTLLSSYFGAYTSGNLAQVIEMHAHSPYLSDQNFLTALQQEREAGYRIWGYEVFKYEMINANEAAVLVSYSYDTIMGKTRLVSEWWRVNRVNGLWKVAWMTRK